jgi:ABC-type transport system involved in cytochrome c biogenesis ATPase subunit
MFEPLTFSLAAGDRVAITGPNSVGKSTLLRVIAGMEAATKGSVHLNTRNIASVEQHLDSVLDPAKPSWSIS